MIKNFNYNSMSRESFIPKSRRIPQSNNIWALNASAEFPKICNFFPYKLNKFSHSNQNVYNLPNFQIPGEHFSNVEEHCFCHWISLDIFCKNEVFLQCGFSSEWHDGFYEGSSCHKDDIATSSEYDLHRK